MAVLDKCEPREVFAYFEQICGIPHGSGNTDKISDFLCSFAKEHGLEYIQDEVGNVIIFKDATSGYEEEETVILQGHMDMVAVADADADIDMKTEGLRLAVDGDYVYARGTSLGGDDGIAVAYALALLASNDIPHPALEVVITVNEEVGMEGAAALDTSVLKGRRLLNADNEEEGYILVGCAGGARVCLSLDYDVDDINGAAGFDGYEIKIHGLRGGHSGVEIDKGRANANILGGRLLYALQKEYGDKIRFVSMKGGVADNAIAIWADLKVVCTVDITKAVGRIEAEIKAEYATADPGICIDVEKGCVIEKEDRVASAMCTSRIASFIYSLPNGIQAMSMDAPGLVETSLNLGISETAGNKLTVEFAVRSSIETSKFALIDRLCAIASLAGAKAEVAGVYPGWKYAPISPLREKMIRVHKEFYGKEPVVEAIHAGLECGFFATKIEGLDCVSFGPDMKDIHTTSEKLSISSTERMWKFLCKVLADKG